MQKKVYMLQRCTRGHKGHSGRSWHQTRLGQAQKTQHIATNSNPTGLRPSAARRPVVLLLLAVLLALWLHADAAETC